MIYAPGASISSLTKQCELSILTHQVIGALRAVARHFSREPQMDRALRGPERRESKAEGEGDQLLSDSLTVPRLARMAYRAAACAEAVASSDLIMKSKTFPSGRPTTAIPLTKKVGVDDTWTALPSASSWATR